MLQPDDILGNYRIVRYLGSGGNADVYEGQHIHLKTSVAIKVLKEALVRDLLQLHGNNKFIDQFKEEARLIAGLRHEHIVHVTDFCISMDQCFLVMEYESGGDLRKYYEGKLPLPLDKTIINIKQIASALQYAHDHRVIHRDVKPANMLIGQDGKVKLSDFGIAVVINSSESTLPPANGTPLYMSPEQCDPERGLTDASDQYSLGIVAYEWLSGKRPFPGLTRGEPPPLRQSGAKNPHICSAVERVVLRALAIEPEKRYPSIEKFAQALEEASKDCAKKSSNFQKLCLIALIFVLCMAAALPIAGFFLLNVPHPSSSCGNGHTPAFYDLPLSLAQGICVDNNHIGLSEGSIVFDTTRGKEGVLMQQTPDDKKMQESVAYKLQAAHELQGGHQQQALQDLQQAIKLDPSDGEAQIYAENLRVLLSHCRYIVIVVSTMLTKSGDSNYIGVGRDDLQGAFIADHQFNQPTTYQCNGQSTVTKVLLLIANSGSHTDTSKESVADVTRVANQIIYLSYNPSFAGVIGWPFSAGSLIALPLLKKYDIPMISQTSTSDELNGPPFYRIAPSNVWIALQAAQYAKYKLKASDIAVIYYSGISFSETLKNDFIEAFNHTIPGTQQASAVDCKGLNAIDCLKHVQTSVPNANLFFFTGYADTFDALRGQMFLQNINTPIMGGDTLYELHNFTKNYRQFYFVSFSYPDNKSMYPQFFTDYTKTFDPQGLKLGTYSFGRADNDAILSFDAMRVLLHGCQLWLGQHGKLTLQQLNTRLLSMPAVQGASGQIKFDENGNPINKVVLLFYVDANHHTQLKPSN
ncbi:MAG: bifunctional serine/threonine-protein kinase/ABC transporter substrate-binding protein [Ktedonobacteraceae bacterium]